MCVCEREREREREKETAKETEKIERGGKDRERGHRFDTLCMLRLVCHRECCGWYWIGHSALAMPSGMQRLGTGHEGVD